MKNERWVKVIFFCKMSVCSRDGGVSQEHCYRIDFLIKINFWPRLDFFYCVFSHRGHSEKRSARVAYPEVIVSYRLTDSVRHTQLRGLYRHCRQLSRDFRNLNLIDCKSRFLILDSWCLTGKTLARVAIHTHTLTDCDWQVVSHTTITIRVQAEGVKLFLFTTY